MLLGVAFLPVPLGFLAWIGYVPLLIALDRRLAAGASLRALFGLGYVFGLAFYLVGVHWIALLSPVAITAPWLKWPAWLLAAGYLALYGGATAVLAGWATRRSGWSLAATFPPAALLVEELRASGELGFPWFQPGYSQHAYVAPLQLAGLGSVSLVTLWVLILNALAWRTLAPAAPGGRLRAALGLTLALALPWAWGMQVLRAAPQAETPRPVVALVQGNIPGEIKWSGRHQRAVLGRFLTLSDSAASAEPKPALLIWPETATGSYLRRQIDQSLAVVDLAARTGVPVFAGFADAEWDSAGRERHYNAAGTFLPTGRIGEVYAKRHLVPFGERIPFQRLVPALGRMDFGQAEWASGSRTVLVPSAAGPFSCLICFEAIFPDLARSDVRAGARWLVNITNDEWFGNSAALYQHAAMAVFRTVENGVPMARCANTGLTLLIDSYGRVVGRLPVFRPAVLEDRLPPPGRPTFYGRFGDWPGVLAALGLLIALLRPRGAHRASGAAR